MFLHLSFKRQINMSLASVVLFSLLSLLTFGCKLPEEDTGSIYGTWKSSYNEQFVIEPSTIISKFSGNTIYKGNNLFIKELSDSSGYIYFKYTGISIFDSDYKSTYTEDPDTSKDLNNYFAIYYKDLTDESVKLSTAYKDTGKTSVKTLEEAKEEFTIENNYFAYNSECVKTSD